MTRRHAEPMAVGALETILSSKSTPPGEVVGQLLGSLPFRSLVASLDHVVGWQFCDAVALCVPSRTGVDAGVPTPRPMLIAMMQTVGASAVSYDPRSQDRPLLRLSRESFVRDVTPDGGRPSRVSFLPTHARGNQDPSTLSLPRGWSHTFEDDATVCGVSTEGDGIVLMLAPAGSCFMGDVRKMGEPALRVAVDAFLKCLLLRPLLLADELSGSAER